MLSDVEGRWWLCLREGRQLSGIPENPGEWQWDNKSAKACPSSIKILIVGGGGRRGGDGDDLWEGRISWKFRFIEHNHIRYHLQLALIFSPAGLSSSVPHEPDPARSCTALVRTP